MLLKGKSIREPVRVQKIISYFNRNKNNDNQKHLDVSIFQLVIGPKHSSTSKSKKQALQKLMTIPTLKYSSAMHVKYIVTKVS